MISRRDAWQHLSERVDALSLRERALLFLVVIGAVSVLAWLAIFAPMNAERVWLESRLATEQRQTSIYERQAQAMLARDGEGAGGEAKALDARLKAVNARLAAATQGLVSPRQMAHLVEDVLAKQHGLRLISIENLPPQSVVLAAGAPALYKHGLKLEIEGSYVGLERYLRALEHLPWKLFWGEVELKAQRWPDSRLTLTLYTLSRDSRWIGA